MSARLKTTTSPSVEELRRRLSGAFTRETAAPGYVPGIPSSGHCAAVAVIVQHSLGGEFISTIVDGQSHWLNRLSLHGQLVDLDLTGDQFGRPTIQVGPPGTLYPGTRVRLPEEVNAETLGRASRLADRAGLVEIAARLQDAIRKRATAAP
jgi:hypothetical protein